ncbi:monocarboxylate transporter 11-like [Patiria miniata]|uniref:Major facilitator superfamily (MFS) profile domain-containing protein n=1 Tax=Patiria miniata TaxID=46514 RepID=A0A914AAR3_PATMI|nr:monocarboxylate transporter 11-like [Patiria miniata]
MCHTSTMAEDTPRENDPKNRDPCRGRGCGQLRITRWGRVVVVASFLTFLLHNGVLGTFGAFIPLLLKEFQQGSGQLGWVVSSGIAVENFAGPVGNMVARRIGCRRAVMLGGALLACGTATASLATSVYHLFVCLGLIAGLGGSIIHVAIVIAVGQFYSRHYTVANGIAYAGPGAGVFVFPPLIEYLNETYGWRGSLVIEAAIVSNVMVMGALFRPAAWFKSRRSSVVRDDEVRRQLDYEPLATGQMQSGIRDGSYEDDGSSDSGISELSLETKGSRRSSTIQPPGSERDFSSKSSTKTTKTYRRKSILTQTNTPAMLAMCVACVFHTAGYSGISVHLVNQAVSSGMTIQQASLLLSCIGIGSLVGRLSHGWFLTRKYITPSWMYTLSLLVSVVATAMLPLTTTFGGKIVLATAAGFCSGVYFSLVAVILRELVGILYLGVAFGASLFCSGLGTLLGGYVIGVLKDVTGSYCIPYYLVSVFFAVAASFSLPRPVIQWYRARNKRRQEPRPTPV